MPPTAPHRRAFLLSLILVPLLLLGCDVELLEPTRTVIGPDGNPIGETIEPRIVVLAPALGVICQDLGLEDQIIGKHAWDQSLGSSIPAVGTHDDPDLEAIIGLAPTHILVQRMETPAPGVLEKMADDQGWLVWSFPLLDLDDIAEAIDEIHLRFRGGTDTGFDPERPESIDPTERLGAELPSARLADAWRDRGPPARQAGRVLLLAQTDPPGAMGPGSYHHQLLERLGASPAITTGGPWQELDHEDIVRLAPDAIIVFAPRPRETGGVGSARVPGLADAIESLGGIASLDLPAIRQGRVALIDDPLCLMPASSLAGVADRMGEAFEAWAARKAQP
jgi:ABC-type Fe3+-hydroxamate transport system substrate-binding protein